MHRRDYIKTITLGSILPIALGCKDSLISGNYSKGPGKVRFKSNWHQWDDMKWAGPEYWGNTLQDWMISKGRLVCDITNKNRNIHLLTLQNPNGNAALKVDVSIQLMHTDMSKANSGCIGFRIGAKGPFDDYRSAAVFGKGIDIGLTPQGQLKVGDQFYQSDLAETPKAFNIYVSTKAKYDLNQYVAVKIEDIASGNMLFEQDNIVVPNEDLKGNIALLADIDIKGKVLQNRPSVAFEDWIIESDNLYQNKDHIFGPICFAQYTLNKNTLKNDFRLHYLALIAV